jgi:hypothetical protein
MDLIGPEPGGRDGRPVQNGRSVLKLLLSSTGLERGSEAIEELAGRSCPESLPVHSVVSSTADDACSRR